MKKSYIKRYASTLRVIVFLFLTGICGISFAQTPEEVLPEDEIYVREADKIYNFGDKRDAQDLYKLALELNPGNVRANYMMGMCYLETIHKPKGLKYFKKALELNPDYNPRLLFYIAECMHFNHDFDDAIIYYNKYKKKVEDDFAAKKIGKEEKAMELEAINRKIIECDNGKEFVKNPIRVKISNMGRNINKAYPDYTPAITGDEKILVFTSRRPGSVGDLKYVDMFHFEDIYISMWDEEKQVWGKAKNIGPPINTESHDAVISISSDGSELFIYKDAGNGDIYRSFRNNDDSWTKPTPIKEVNTGAFENHLTSSVEGDIYIFSSNRKGGEGNLDLWMIKINDKGKWGKPHNLGPKINTPFKEESPFLDADGTLYFSSRGHKGMGGYDIFRTKYDEATGEWSEPENLGYPINTADDDYGFILPGDGQRGYYSSFKDEGRGEKDLYMIEMNPEEKSMEICFEKKTKTIDWIFWEDYKRQGAEKGACPQPDPIIDICYNGESMKVKKSEWPIYQEQGASFGSCSMGDPTGGMLVICHNGENIQISASEWPEHKGHGDVQGNCPPSSVERIIVCHKGETIRIPAVDWALHQGHGDSKGECPIIADGPDADIVLQGTVKDAKTGNPVPGARIVITDASTGEEVTTLRAGADGGYSHNFTKKGGRLYVVVVEAPGYKFASERVPTPRPSNMKQTVIQDFFLELPCVDCIYVLKNVYFDFDKSTLKRESIIELNALEKFLNENPSAKVEMRGHTDNKGSDEYNLKLSDQRAQIVVKYLLRRGISSARMIFKGYGESIPIATNDDEIEGRELNRRTEFKILSK